MTIVEAPVGITSGVDTHLDKHVAAALDPLGRLVGTESFDADAAGYKALLVWLEDFGEVTKVGVEGTGSYGGKLQSAFSASHQVTRNAVTCRFAIRRHIVPANRVRY